MSDLSATSAQTLKIPGYQIKKIIGRGGMASVYLATQESLDRDVALKVMLRNLANDETFTQRFLREGPTVARLTHPNIVKVFDTGVYEDCYYMSMEYLPGGTLKQRLHRMSIEESLDVIKALGSALGYAHQQKIVHRDVKPQNVLFYESGSPVLSDFGIAKALSGESGLTATGVYMGSANYMSPEQVRGETLDARSDLYALGVLFYEMLMGEPPFTGDDAFSIAYKHVTDPIPELPPVLAQFQPIINQLMAKRPQDRFPDVAAFYQALKRAEIAYYVPTGPDVSSSFSMTHNDLSAMRVSNPSLPHLANTDSSLGLLSNTTHRTGNLRSTTPKTGSLSPADPPPRPRSLLSTLLIMLVSVAVGGLGVYFVQTPPAPTTANPVPRPIMPTTPVAPPPPVTRQFDLPPVAMPTPIPAVPTTPILPTPDDTPPAPPIAVAPPRPASPPAVDSNLSLIPPVLDLSSNVSRAGVVVPQPVVPTTVSTPPPAAPPTRAAVPPTVSPGELIAQMQAQLANNQPEAAYTLLAQLPTTVPEYGNLVERIGNATETALNLSRDQRRAIQARLNALGYAVGNPDGVFGAQTRRALRQAQSTRQQTVTGYLSAALAGELLTASR